MKTLKKAEQRNFLINEDYYSPRTLAELEQGVDGIFRISDDWSNNPDYELRISTNVVKEVKVIYNEEYCNYENVVVTYENRIIHIKL